MELVLQHRRVASDVPGLRTAYDDGTLTGEWREWAGDRIGAVRRAVYRAGHAQVSDHGTAGQVALAALRVELPQHLASLLPPFVRKKDLDFAERTVARALRLLLAGRRRPFRCRGSI
jgi:hypothetical protein